MGYTHYWRGNESQIDIANWPSAIADCDKIIASEHNRLRLQVEPAGSMIDLNGDPDRLAARGLGPLGDTGEQAARAYAKMRSLDEAMRNLGPGTSIDKRAARAKQDAIDAADPAWTADDWNWKAG